MSGRTSKRYFVGDFETTVYKGQERTDVWAGAITEMFDGTDKVEVFHTINDTFEYLVGLHTNMVVYFHNLKFDGAFWLNYFLKDLGYKLAIDGISLEYDGKEEWLERKDMLNNTFRCSISAMGMWYSITVKVKNKFIEFRDSLKLLPFKVREIGWAFKTRHQKLDMEYEGFRYPGCPISDHEKEYIANDVLVVKEALEFMYQQGHKKLTIGSCCLNEYKTMFENDRPGGWDHTFPNVYEIPLDKEKHGYATVGEWIHRSYRGGWCYLVKGKENKLYHNGTTADVNSLYPSMMHSESGNRYPVGKPTFWEGDNIDLAYLELMNRYYFIHIRTRFYIKPGKLPFIQIKNSLRFKMNESLTTSDYWDEKTQRYYDHYWFGPSRAEQTLHDTAVDLYLTMTDYKLLKDHYDLVNCEVIDGCWFETQIGLFDEYINHYRDIKVKAKGAMRTLAKLFLNNLYGKMASSKDSSFKVPFLREDGSLGLRQVQESDKEPGYIPIGSAITSYARNFTIRAAQANYYGVDKPGFVYADTDSIHCDLPKEAIKGISVHPTAFCCWKLESCWDNAWFTRQKTYIEHITEEDEQPIEKPYYNVKCAGMPDKCKELFIASLEKKYINYDDLSDEDKKKYDAFTKEEKEAVNAGYELKDFVIGLSLPGKLMPKRIPGGVLLVDTQYKMR